MSESAQISSKWVDGLFNQILKPSIHYGLQVQLKEEGLDLSLPVSSNVPRERFARWVHLVARELFPGKEQAEALRSLGAKVMDDVKASGKLRTPVIALARLAGPTRVLKQLAEHVHGQGSIHVRFQAGRSKNEASIELNEGELVDFVGGALERILTFVGAKRPTATATHASPEHSLLTVRWS